MAALVFWLARRKRQGKPTLLDPELFKSKHFRLGISQQMLQQIALGGTMIALPIYLQMVLEYNAMQAGLSIAPLSLSMFGSGAARGEEGGNAPPEQHRPVGVRAPHGRDGVLIPIVPRADSGWYLLVPLVIAGSGLGLLVSQLNNYTLAPISEERVSEAAGVNSAGGSFGLSFGLAFAGAIMLATLSITFTDMAEASTVLAPAEQQQVAKALEDDAQVMSNTQLDELLVGQPEDVQAEIIRINTDARPLALQVALLVPILAGLVGLFNSFRMMRLPDITPSGSVEGMAWADLASLTLPPSRVARSPGSGAVGCRAILPVGPFDPCRLEVGAHCGPDRGVEVVVAEPLVERVALEPVLHRVLHLGEAQVDALAGELLVKLPEDVGGGGVEVGDGFGSHDRPSHRRRRRRDGLPETVGEHLGVGEEQRCVPSEQDQAGHRLASGWRETSW